MSSEEILKEIKKIVTDTIPPGAVITNIDFEGPEVVIYTRNPGMLVDDGEIVKELAKNLRKRVIVKPDSSVLTTEEEAVQKIKNLVPDEAEITDISFDPSASEVIIEAKKPGLVIGKSGQTLRDITRVVRWAPIVRRTPPLQSDTIKAVRSTLQKEANERKDILKKIGHRIYRTQDVRSEWIRVSFLGGFREVGRSCIMLQTPESKIMLDCGVNVASNDPKIAYPHLDIPEFKYILNAKELDAIIVSHAHLDHCGFIPYLYKYGYEGPVYCTPPTRDLMTLLQLDYIDVASRENHPVPYSRKDVKNVIHHTIPVDFKEVRDISPDIRLTFHNSGHILGSAMVHLHVGNGLHNIVYTGDFNFETSKLLEKASFKFPRLESLIIESTYGGSQDMQMPRGEAEKNLLRIIYETTAQGGKVLIPVLSVGRAQEIMLLLEELMEGGALEKMPVYLDGMIWEATAIHTAYPEYLSKDLREMIFHQGKNPFLSETFENVNTNDKRKSIIEGPPCIILATSGMLVG
ncbi:MAG TPA: beta-CASP ribonuclease aCPSF1, partial [Methanofastidiosum sp.]|nr:beta-CASP ribonuclease aCPSF1 [Methanofastidiosum sp.]